MAAILDLSISTALLRSMPWISLSATEATTTVSFSSMQIMLLSNEAPRTMSAAGFFNVGGLVDDDGGVAGAGADGALAAGHGRLDHTAATGDDEDADARVLHELAGGFDGRFRHADDGIGRTAGGDDGLVEERDGLDGALLGGRDAR